MRVNGNLIDKAVEDPGGVARIITANLGRAIEGPGHLVESIERGTQHAICAKVQRGVRWSDNQADQAPLVRGNDQTRVNVPAIVVPDVRQGSRIQVMQSESSAASPNDQRGILRLRAIGINPGEHGYGV